MQVIIFILVIMGGGVLLSVVPVYIRCRMFEENVKKFYRMRDVSYKELRAQLIESSIEVSLLFVCQ